MEGNPDFRQKTGDDIGIQAEREHAESEKKNIFHGGLFMYYVLRT